MSVVSLSEVRIIIGGVLLVEIVAHDDALNFLHVVDLIHLKGMLVNYFAKGWFVSTCKVTILG